MLKVSAVLLNWRRAYHIPRIVESLLAHPFVDDIVVWNNASEFREVVSLDRVKIVNSSSNVCTYGRFLAVGHCANEIIITQDDDVVVRNFPDLVMRFVADQTRIVAGLAETHHRVEAHKTPHLQLGWGSVFHRDWVHVLNRWIEAYGEDELLCRKADRIFTTLVGRHDPVMGDFERLADPVTGRDSDRDNNSLWLRQDHVRLTNEAVSKALILRDFAPDA